MPEISFDPSCEVAAEQLVPFAETHRLTVICGLLAPATGEIALVRSVKAIGQESEDQMLKPAQGGIDPGETAADAFLREVQEEYLGFDMDSIRTVVGLPMSEVMTGGRPGRGRGRSVKAFAVFCGIVAGRPELVPNPEELASAGWFSQNYAERAFMIQAGHAELAERGYRNLRVLDAIRGIDLTRF
jgi:8-oxo-dGTP pyrophosphatase MutT (NUDIX family)